MQTFWSFWIVTALTTIAFYNGNLVLLRLKPDAQVKKADLRWESALLAILFVSVLSI